MINFHNYNRNTKISVRISIKNFNPPSWRAIVLSNHPLSTAKVLRKLSSAFMRAVSPLSYRRY